MEPQEVKLLKSNVREKSLFFPQWTLSLLLKISIDLPFHCFHSSCHIVSKQVLLDGWE